MVARRAATAAPTPMAERLGRSFRRIPAEDTPRLFRLRLTEIEPNPDQPRRHIEEERLRELAQSIEQHGLIQPITVKRLPDSERYLLVAGERRFRAHEFLGREEILAVVTTGSADEISLIENIQRQDLHPLEEATAMARMMERHGWTQEELARTVGKARTTVTNILKLNQLPDQIRADSLSLGSEGPSKSLLFEIARVEGQEAQMALWQEVREGGTVRSVRGRAEVTASRKPAAARGPLEPALAAGRRFLRHLQEIRLDGPDSGAQQEELLHLCAELERHLRRLKTTRRPARADRDV
jgi:ParB family chromosome partitioning protein